MTSCFTSKLTFLIESNLTHFEVIFAECEITVLYTLLPYKLQNDNSQTFMKKVGIRESWE